MNYRITSMGFNEWASGQTDAEEIAQKFCDKQSLYARKGYPITCEITYNGVFVKTVSVDGKC